MSVFQPLYFSGGRYTAGTDRKLLAAVFGADSSGDRIVGVIPSNIGTDSLRVSLSSALTVNIATGMCLIADQSAQDNESPGLYLAGVDTVTESITLATADATDTKYDVIYAEVNETPYFITSKALVSDVAELTTSSAHGFLADQTVVVSGVDDIFDGTYIITTVPTATKFRYAKTHADVATFASPTLVVATATGYPASGTAIVTATISNKVLTSNIATLTTASAHGLVEGEMITVKGVDAVFDGVHQLIEGTTGSTLKYSINKVADNVTTVAVSTAGGNSVAVARVPFAIKKVRNAASGSSYPASITAIELAEITVAANAIAITQANIADLRKFVPTSGGMHIYNSTSSAALPGSTNPSSGMMRYDVSNNRLEVYDSTAAAFKILYTNTSSGEVFPRLGGSLGGTATTAARGDHVHTSFSTIYGAITNSSYIDATIPANTTSLAASWSGKSAAGGTFTTSASGRVLINMSALIYTYNTDKASIISLRVGTGTSINAGTAVLTQSTSGKNSIRMEGGSTANIGIRTGVSFVLGLTANTAYNACFYYYNNDTTAVPINDAYIEFIPIP